MQRFFLYANPGKPETFPFVRLFAEQLRSSGCEILMDPWLHDILGQGLPLHPDNLDPGMEAVVSFGGDGTLLRILPLLARLEIPVLGVNLGHTGFLLETGPDDLANIVARLAKREYSVQRRAMLSCVVIGNGSYLVMNEVALTRGKNPSSLVVDVLYNEELVFTIHGDGVLVSTPTGTTGYSLSAGGPILYPDVPCHVVVPICSHILHQRAVVLPQTGEIRLAVRANRGMMHQICMDGQIVLDLETNSEVIITPAVETARFIRFKPQQFLARLQQKQLEWSNHENGGNP